MDTSNGCARIGMIKDADKEQAFATLNLLLQSVKNFVEEHPEMIVGATGEFAVVFGPRKFITVAPPQDATIEDVKAVLRRIGPRLSAEAVDRIANETLDRVAA
jgi:hypothetical protein